MATPFACFSRPALIIQLLQLANKFFADSAIAAPDFNVGRNYLKLARVCPDTGRAVSEMAVPLRADDSGRTRNEIQGRVSKVSAGRRAATLVGRSKVNLSGFKLD